jgi:two-component system, NarL family, response regulator DevR
MNPSNLSTERRIRVFIVDDHPLARKGLRSIFEDYPQILVVGEADDGAKALTAIPALQPNVALVDLYLPDQDGCSLCRMLKSLPQPPHVLILSSFGDEGKFLNAIGSGADGYVLKDSHDDVLVSAITMVASGGTVWPRLATRTLRERLQSNASQAPSKLGLLSDQERRVLAQITEGKTNKEIGALLNIPEKTIRNQVSSLMEKLGVDRRAQAAAYYIRYQDISSPHLD